MERFKIFEPSSTKSAFGYGENVSNYAVVVPTSMFRTLRNSVIIDNHIRRVIQDRPFHYFNGSAEHLLLRPLAQNLVSVSSGTSTADQPIDFFLQLAKNMSAVSRGLNMAKGKTGVGSLAQVISSILPTTTAGSPAAFAIPEQGKPIGYSLFTNFIQQLLESPDARATVYKTLSSPTYAPMPTTPDNITPTNATIQQMITGMEIFGLSGKQQPLFGSAVDNIFASRFAVEQYLFSQPSSAYEEDNRIAAAIWYLMYNAIVQTPESYDSAMPVVPLTPTDGVIASSTLSVLGSLTQTAYAAASSPIMIDAVMVIKQLSETIEFLSASQMYDEVEAAKAKAILTTCQSIVTEMAYAPTVTLANTVFDYVKRLSGARYLLPHFLTRFQTEHSTFMAGGGTSENPFAPLRTPPGTIVPTGFRGFLKDAQRVAEFGGLDIPRLLSIIKSKAKDLHATLVSYAHIYETITSGLALPKGSVFVHLDSLGVLENDPTIGTIEYPSPTDVYLVPSYVRKYNILTNDESEWYFQQYLYKPFFPTTVQLDNLTVRAAKDYFAWDTAVSVPASPSTASDFGYLCIPFGYVQDCYSKRLSNDMASVSQFLAASPYRPMSQVADYFTPVFQTLSGALSKPSVVANALSSMFLIYEARSGGSGQPTDETSWKLIEPTIPFIYGRPTKVITAINSPFGGPDAAPVLPKHIKVEERGNYMIVLHRRLPKPTALSYIPWVLDGGLKVSLPVATSLHRTAVNVTNAQKPINPDVYWAKYSAALLSSASYVADDYFNVASWAPSFCLFPHIFFTNRHLLTNFAPLLDGLQNIVSRRVIVSDENSPLGGVMTYFPVSVVAFDISDSIEALSSSELLLDIDKDVKAKKMVKGSNKLPSTPLNEEATMGSSHKTDTTSVSASDKSGKVVSETVNPVPGSGTALKPESGLGATISGPAAEKVSPPYPSGDFESSSEASND